MKVVECCNVITIEKGIVTNIKSYYGDIDACGKAAEAAFTEITGLTGDDLAEALDNGSYDYGNACEVIISWSDVVENHLTPPDDQT